MAVVARALHHLDPHQADHQVVALHQVVHLRVAAAVDRQLPVQVHLDLPVHIAMAHHLAVVPQVVATHPIAVHIQVAHLLHVEILPVQVRVHHQIVANAVTVHVTPVRLPIARPVHMVIDQNVVMIAVHLVIAQQVVPMETATHVRHHAQVLIVANAVTVQEIHDHLQIAPIVHLVLTVTDPSVVMIVVHQVTDQQVVRTEIVTRVHRHAQVQIVPIVRHVAQRVDRQIDAIALRHVATQIVQPAVRTVIVTHVRHRAHLPIAANAVTVHATHVHLPIVRVAKTHTVAIAHAQAMIATLVRLRVTANAVADQIVPEVASPMIAKNVHAVVLAKSA